MLASTVPGGGKGAPVLNEDENGTTEKPTRSRRLLVIVNVYLVLASSAASGLSEMPLPPASTASAAGTFAPSLVRARYALDALSVAGSIPGPEPALESMTCE